MNLNEPSVGVEQYVAKLCSAYYMHLELGEGIIWDSVRERLLWVDIDEGIVFEGSVSSSRLSIDRTHKLGETTGAVAPTSDGGLIVAGAKHVHLLNPDGIRTRSIRVIPEKTDSRLNDGKCDPAGRFLVGSLALDDREGKEFLYMVESDGAVRPLVKGLTLTNGIGFSPDGKVMYLADSIPGIIYSFQYNIASGKATRRKVLWEGDGTPDGMTVDAEGNLWVAFWGDGQIRKLNPKGQTLGTVRVSAPNVTCGAFYGRKLDRMIITTAREGLDQGRLSHWPDSGALFTVNPRTVGLPTTPWAGETS